MINRNKLTILILLNIVWLLGACASVGPDYREPENQLPLSWQHAVENIEGQQDNQLWWQNFNDPHLNKLIELALQENLNVQSAQSKLREARAQQSATFANNFPSITASSSGQESRNKPNHEMATHSQSYQAGFDASWEIDIFGGRRRSDEAARANTQAVAADLDDVKVSLIAEVATNYFNLKNSVRQQQIAELNIQSRKKTLALVQSQQKAGLVSVLEVRQAQSSLAQIESSLPDIQQQIEVNKISLGILLNKTQAQLEPYLPEKYTIEKVKPEIALSFPADVLRQRPDIKATERRLAMQTAQIGVAVAEKYPKFNLSGNLGLRALTGSGLFDADTVVSSLLGSISAPIFNAGRINQNIVIQTERQKQAILSYQAALLQGLADVEKALSAYQKAQDKQKQLAINVQVAGEAERIAQIKYKTGQIGLLNVLDTQRTLWATQDQLNQAQTNELLNLIQLYKALGGGWQVTTGEINESKN
ncbi:efflux transporter outer membrane subunit [Neisseria sp. Ec49-e6-T10]|uniref:efflux transporter outer membrane subunit n=1 Tax=Neisseria sp. Ec49-e6-T10 TaxID=3140744 RepID=UPI003EBBA7EE